MTQSQADLVTEIKLESTWIQHEWEALKQCLQSDLLTDGSGFLPKHRVFTALYLNYLVCLADEYCDGAMLFFSIQKQGMQL